MRSRAILLLGILAAYTLLHVHPLSSAETRSRSVASKPEPTGKQNAAQLLDNAQKALAYTVKSARTAGEELDAKNPSAKPFLQSLQKIGTSLNAAEQALAAKDKSFFQAISDAQAGVEEMQITWDLTKSNDAGVIKGGRALGGAVSALHNDYGPTAQRKAKGGELSAAELANFQKLKAGQSDFRKKIHTLLAGFKKDPALEAGLRKLNKRSQEIEKSPGTVDAYAGALDFLSTISGLLNGYSYYVPAAQRKSWNSLIRAADSWEVYYTPGSDYDWSYTETPVEVYDSYDLEVTSEEMASEEAYIEDSSFEMSESESEEVAEESSEITEDEAQDSEMESEQEDMDEQEDAEDMGAEDDGGNDNAEDAGGDDGGGDDGGGGEEMGGGDDGGGEQ